MSTRNRNPFQSKKFRTAATAQVARQEARVSKPQVGSATGFDSSTHRLTTTTFVPDFSARTPYHNPNLCAPALTAIMDEIKSASTPSMVEANVDTDETDEGYYDHPGCSVEEEERVDSRPRYQVCYLLLPSLVQRLQHCANFSHKGNSVLIQPLVDFMPLIQDEILAHFADSRIFSWCPTCPQREPVAVRDAPHAHSAFRCNDCGYLPPCCRDCIIFRHRHQPFHRIEEWRAGFFRRCNNAELGIRLLLGHHGELCPHAPTGPISRRLTVQDENTIHEVKVVFCQCPSPPSFLCQLLQARILPATVEEPQIGFTFASLHAFHIHMTTSKKSAHDHCIALRRLTSYAFPDQVKV
jgi:hypothetical protein